MLEIEEKKSKFELHGWIGYLDEALHTSIEKPQKDRFFEFLVPKYEYLSFDGGFPRESKLRILGVNFKVNELE